MKPKNSFLMKEVSLSYINILPQLRKVFDAIDELASDIKEKGLIHPVSIAVFDKKDCAQYIKIVNKLWKEKIKVNNLVSCQKKYLVLLSGERRLRACRKLQMEKIRGTLYSDISAMNALMLQASENTYVPPKPEEMASFYDKFYSLLVLSGKKMSYTKFAESVGRSPDVIRNAIKFSRLPKKIRKLVDDETISYGIACEVARLHQNGMKTEELMGWCINAIVKNMNGDDFRKTVSKYLAEKKSSQTSLFDIFDVIGKEELIKNSRKRSVERKTSEAFYAGSKYFLRILYLFEHNLLGLEESPFSMKGPLNAFLYEVSILEKTLSHMKKLLKAKDLKRGGEAIAKDKAFAQTLQN